MYLDVGVQSQIQLQFEAESQIELPDFLLVGQRSVYQTIVSFYDLLWLYNHTAINMLYSNCANLIHAVLLLAKRCVDDMLRLACWSKLSSWVLDMFLYLIGGEVSTVVQRSAKLKT